MFLCEIKSLFSPILLSDPPNWTNRQHSGTESVYNFNFYKSSSHDSFHDFSALNHHHVNSILGLFAFSPLKISIPNLLQRKPVISRSIHHKICNFITRHDDTATRYRWLSPQRWRLFNPIYEYHHPVTNNGQWPSTAVATDQIIAQRPSPETPQAQQEDPESRQTEEYCHHLLIYRSLLLLIDAWMNNQWPLIIKRRQY